MNAFIADIMKATMKAAPHAGQPVDEGLQSAIGIGTFTLLLGIAMVTAAVGVFCGKRWGWILSLVVAAVAVYAGAEIYSLYSAAVDVLESTTRVPAVISGEVEAAHSVAHRALRMTLLFPALVLFGYALLTCLLLLTPSVRRTFWHRSVRRRTYATG